MLSDVPTLLARYRRLADCDVIDDRDVVAYLTSLEERWEADQCLDDVFLAQIEALAEMVEARYGDA